MSAVVSISLVVLTGCESDAQTGTLIGTAAGAGIGALAGGDTEATLIGGAIGGGVGYGLGNEGDKKKMQAEIDSMRNQQATETIWITDSNGAQRPITLRRSGPNLIGPQGEYYSSMPTQEQLQQRYAQ